MPDPPPNEPPLTELLLALHEVTTALARAQDFDALCRLAVELAVERLGFERVGIWFLTPGRDEVTGSFGVDEKGAIRDERGARLRLRPESNETAMMKTRRHETLLRVTPLFNHRGETIGHGHHAYAALWNGEDTIGYVTVDNLFTGRPVTETGMQLLGLFASVLGHLCTLKRTEAALRASSERAAAFQALGRKLNASSSPEEAARTILDVADRLIGWDACWLEMWDSEKEPSHTVLLVDLMDGERRELPGPTPRTAMSERARERAAGGSQLVLRRRGEVDPTRLPLGDESRQSASLMFTPICSHGQNVGLLSIQSYTFDAYGPADLSLLAALAEYCGEALQRTRAEAMRDRMEERLRQAQRMESVGQLAGGIAHYYNNLVAVINGYSELLVARGETDPWRLDALQNIQTAGQRIADLTQQLLAFARKQILLQRKIELNSLIQADLTALEGRLGSGIRLETRLEPDLPSIRADPDQVLLMLHNILQNARDAMPEGGTVTLSTSTVREDASDSQREEGAAPGLRVVVTVSDTGHGMASDTMSRAFEPFFTTREVGQGTGLGLATVFGIMQQHGGLATIASDPGAGTTVSLSFPSEEPLQR